MARIIYRVHSLERMFQRGISTDDVKDVLTSGEVIEDYPDDSPYPSRLISGQARGRHIHVVAAYNRVDDENIVITVYQPDPDQWDKEFRRRKI